jgi:hypothetical protein
MPLYQRSQYRCKGKDYNPAQQPADCYRTAARSTHPQTCQISDMQQKLESKLVRVKTVLDQLSSCMLGAHKSTLPSYNICYALPCKSGVQASTRWHRHTTVQYCLLQALSGVSVWQIVTAWLCQPCQYSSLSCTSTDSIPPNAIQSGQVGHHRSLRAWPMAADAKQTSSMHAAPLSTGTQASNARLVSTTRVQHSAFDRCMIHAELSGR